MSFYVLLNEFKNLIFDYKNQIIKDIDLISNKHIKILQCLYASKKYKQDTDININKNINTLLKICIFSRDKYYGLGSLDLFNIQLYNFIHFTDNKLIHQKNIEFIIDSLVKERKIFQLIGSWKDYKYILKYCIKTKNMNINNHFIKYIINKYVSQINYDIKNLKNNENISLCGKWIPREKSSFGWIVPLIISKLFNINITNNNKSQYFSYFKDYRQILSNLNKNLHTPEIYMCENNWNKIQFYKNHSEYFYSKYHNAFLLTGRKNIYSQDRNDCKEKYSLYCKNYLHNVMNKDEYIDKYFSLFYSYKNFSFKDFQNYLNNLYLLSFNNHFYYY